MEINEEEFFLCRIDISFITHRVVLIIALAELECKYSCD